MSCNLLKTVCRIGILFDTLNKSLSICMVSMATIFWYNLGFVRSNETNKILR